MKICEYCKEDYIPKDPIKAHWGRQRFCSPRCSNKSKTGKIHWKLSDETKRKMSLSKKGKKMSIAKKGKRKYSQMNNLDIRKYENWVSNLHLKRKRSADGSHTYDEWENLKAQYNWTCPCCNKREPEIKLTEDHIIPLSKGGSDNIENIQPLCPICNSQKHTKTIKYENVWIKSKLCSEPNTRQDSA